MLFNSLTYLLFLAAMVPLYWVLPHVLRRPMLLVASFVFYCWWRWQYGLLFGASILVNFYMATLVHARPSRMTRALPVIVNLGILGYYKYLGFLARTANDLIAFVTHTRPVPVVDVLLPLGISFFTFQAMSYVIDVARRDRDPEKSVFDFAFFLAFWPHLIAGPLMRSHELIPQLMQRHTLRYDHIAEGLKRIVFGLFLKVVLADNISPFVDEGFSAATWARNSALDNWTLAFAFGLQIYFDFAGYSSIGIGSARLMGFTLSENFDFPYVATSPRDFWKRWHITLSSWIRDYLYIPLQGLVAQPSHSTGGLAVDADPAAKGGRRRSNVALVMTWMIMGLWHGANWTFVLWGLWHAMLILGHRALGGAAKASPSFAKVRATALGRWTGAALTLAGSMVGWIFFRAPNVRQALKMVGTLCDPRRYGHLSYKENFYLLTFLCTAAFYVAYALHRRIASARPGGLWDRFGFVPASLCYTVVVTLVLGFLRGRQQFIYFQF